MVIRYEERPVGVWDREAQKLVTPADRGWPHYLAWLRSGNKLDQDSTPKPVPTLDGVVAEKVAAVDAIAARLRKRVVGSASAPEMASWGEKLRQAQALVAGAAAANVPMIVLEAQARGVKPAEIAQRVITNADAYSKAEARIAGVAGKHKDAIRAIGSIDQVHAYDIARGWS